MELTMRFNGVINNIMPCSKEEQEQSTNRILKAVKLEKYEREINHQLNRLYKEDFNIQLNLLNDYEPLLTADEVAKVLGICKKNVINNFIKPGILPDFGLSKRGYSVKKTDLASFLTSNNFLPNAPTRGIINTNNN